VGCLVTKKLFTSHANNLPTGDRCYDFLNIFAEKFSEKIGVFDSKQSYIMQKFDHNIGF
jgi:hypothetical protein